MIRFFLLQLFLLFYDDVRDNVADVLDSNKAHARDVARDRNMEKGKRAEQ